MLLLNLNKIRTAQERFEQVYRPDQFDADEDFRVVAPVSLAFDIFKDKQAVPACRAGADDARAAVQPLPRAVHAPVDQAFDLRYQPHTANTGEGEREIEEDDLTTAFYENDEIDLGHLMHEQFVLCAADEAAVRRRLQGAVPGLRHEPESRHVRLQAGVGRPAPRGASGTKKLRTEN